MTACNLVLYSRALHTLKNFYRKRMLCNTVNMPRELTPCFGLFPFPKGEHYQNGSLLVSSMKLRVVAKVALISADPRPWRPVCQKLHVSMLLLICVDGLTPHCVEAARLFSQRVLAIEAFSQEALDLVVLSQREEWVRLRSSNVKPARWRQSCSNTAHADMCLFLVYYSISRWWLCYKGVGKSHCCYYQLIAVGVES